MQASLIVKLLNLYCKTVKESWSIKTNLETHLCESRSQRFQVLVLKATGLGHKPIAVRL